MTDNRRAAAIAVAVAAAVAAFPAGAAADTVSIYPQDLQQRSFFTSAGGWEGGTGGAGSCPPSATCPTVTNSYAGQGGTLGQADGYLRTSISALTGVGSETRGTWRSPTFEYDGAEGRRPTNVVFSNAHLSNLGALLSFGNEAGYSIDLLDQAAGGNALRVAADRPLTPTESWTYRVAEIEPGALQIGHEYRIRITTRFAYGSEVLPGGSVGFDDIGLIAIRDTSGGGGGGGSPGPGTAVFDGRNLFLKLKCFNVHENGRCKVRATAVGNKQGGKRFTYPIQRKVKAKKGKVVRMRVRFKFRKEMESRSAILLRERIRAGEDDAIKFKRIKLIHRD